MDPSDLVPALMTTHTVKNPEYDPAARKRKDLDDEKAITRSEELLEEAREALPAYQRDDEKPAPTYSQPDGPDPETTPRRPIPSPILRKPPNPFGDDDDADIEDSIADATSSSSRSTSTLNRPTPSRLSSFDAEDDDGDIGRAGSPSPLHTPLAEQPPPSPSPSTSSLPTVTLSEPLHDPEKTPSKGPSRILTPSDQTEEAEEPEDIEEAALPSLPGVSTKMSTTDELITLDIRWTVVCRSIRPPFPFVLTESSYVTFSSSSSRTRFTTLDRASFSSEWRKDWALPG